MGDPRFADMCSRERDSTLILGLVETFRVSAVAREDCPNVIAVIPSGAPIPIGTESSPPQGDQPPRAYAAATAAYASIPPPDSTPEVPPRD